MKKLLLLTAIILTTIGFSQPISVSSNSYTVPQLVNNVLINSPCVSATNITWKTGTNFGSSNGIGFFQNNNPNFPMSSGVVLSTGNALNAAGPNTSILNDGSLSWSGDANLEATLASYGIAMVSKNATVLEFDFTPISPNFSFDFIFASEEYGNFQCKYSDAFAFLLTNQNTGVTTNLAVVPNTNTPISVVTIRDFLYNSSCPSVNSQYFGSFNGGSNAAGSATNFNGQTKVLTAASQLTPGVPYHIKLVIADRTDPQSDSAIFISSDSFNIGQDVLGLDMTVASNNAICFGENHTIDTGLNTTNYTFVWQKDGVVMNGQTGSSISVTQPGTYSVTYDNIFDTCIPFTDSVKIEYYPEIVTPDPVDLYRCHSGAASYDYNLDFNTSVIKTGIDPLTTVTYFASQSDADANINPLTLMYNSVIGKTIYVRIQLPNNPCYLLKTFQLLSSPPPVANMPPDIEKCSRIITQNTAAFNFTVQTPIILAGQSSTINSVTYYTSLINATNDTNPISNVLNGVYPNNTTIYVRVQNITDPACFNVTSFNLIVNPAAIVDKLLDVQVCDQYILPPLVNGNYFTSTNGGGLPLFPGAIITETSTIYIFNQPNGPGTCAGNSSFKVTILDSTTLSPKDVTSCGSYTLPKLTFGDYFSAPGGGGTKINGGDVISTTQDLYYYFKSTTAPFCVVDTKFKVTILPLLNIGNRPDVFECASYTLPTLALGNYFTGPAGPGSQMHAGDVITSSQTVYVYAKLAVSSSCVAEDSFEVVIGINQPADVNQCNGFTLPTLPIGNYYTQPLGAGQIIPAGTVINSSATVYIYAQTSGGGPNCTDNMHFNLTIAQPAIDTLNDVTICESYTLPALTNGDYFTGTAGTGTQMFAGDVILTTQTVYIFKRLNPTCYNESSFKVTINPLPNIDSRSDIDICDQYVLSALNVGTYYTGSNATGTILQPGDVITTSQKIYIYAIGSGTPACSIENSFQINIFSTTADAPQNVTACDSYMLPSLTAGNHYYTQSGGPDGSGVEIFPGTVITTTQTLFVFKEALIRTDFSCIDENLFLITINKTPVLPSYNNINSCNSYVLPTLAFGQYYTGPNASGKQLFAGDILTTSQTVYVFANTATSPDCVAEKSFVVTIFNVDDLPNVTICENYILPKLTIGKYYTGPNGTGTVLNSGAIINSSQTIYIYGVAPFLPRCSDESSFTVTIIDTPVANQTPLNLRTTCDTDEINDGIFSFNLSSLTSTILGIQTGSEFTSAYYESLVDAANQTNAVTTSTLKIVYVRVTNTLTTSCYDIKPIVLTVNKLPEPKPVDGIICIDSETGTLLNPYTIYAGLTASTHIFSWTNELGQVVGTHSSYQAILPGSYTLVATSISTGCPSVPVIVNVIPSEPAVVAYSVSDDFADTQTITVTATGQGNNFEYQLDNGAFQDSNVFSDVMAGIHQITVRDKYGCGSTTVQAIVVNYPKFFTPNGDGYNDTWNIKDLSNQSTASIIIYDRYGKVLTQIKPSGSGWDGTYNGYMMPSDDYWFSVSYQDENKVGKEFKAHFAMKR